MSIYTSSQEPTINELWSANRENFDICHNPILQGKLADAGIKIQDVVSDQDWREYEAIFYGAIIGEAWTRWYDCQTRTNSEVNVPEVVSLEKVSNDLSKALQAIVRNLDMRAHIDPIILAQAEDALRAEYNLITNHIK